MAEAPAALVTGCSTGIGRATALELSAQGFRVFAAVRRPEDGEAVQAVAQGELMPLLLDVTDREQIAAAAERIGAETRDGGLAVLVNNAGVAIVGPLEFVPLDDLRRQLEVNLVGHVAVTQAMLPLLRGARSKRRRIVNVTSIGGLVASPFFGPYVASKFAMEGLSDCLRTELRPWGIETIAIEPGSIATSIWARGQETAEEMRSRMDPEAERLYGKALERVAAVSAETGARGIPPEEVARVIHKAVTARRPRARYLVGRDALAMRTMSALLPARLLDAITARAMKLP